MRSIRIRRAPPDRFPEGGSYVAWTRFVVAVLAVGMLALGVGLSQAIPARGSGVTVDMLAVANGQPGYEVLIANFERVYPNITIDATFAPNVSVLEQVENTELAAGNAPDILPAYPGCGTPISTCVLAKNGYLEPMVKVPWAKRSLPLVMSLDKYGQGLFGFLPQITPYAIFTNDALFSRLGLTTPRTFSQLLDVCEKAKSAGTTAVIFGGATATNVEYLLTELAVSNVYGSDKQWAKQLRAGTVSFDGTPGWHQALQQFIDMNNAGCFEPGASGTTDVGAEALYAQGQGLMYAGLTNMIGVINADNPQFSFTVRPFPAGSGPNQTTTYLHLSLAPGINAHSSAQNQAAAQTFINFVARPAQTSLFGQIEGGLTQYELLKEEIPRYVSSFATIIHNHQYVTDPTQTWWNSNVVLALEQDGMGLLTGQTTIDSVLSAMDAAWKLGPS
jgi:raffinose/stachyose/melibiose transport system substrate-binding protein